MAQKTYNHDLNVLGTMNLTAPNVTNAGAVLVWNTSTKTITHRTNSQFIGDLDLPTKTQLASSGSAVVNWGNISNLPSTFPPSAHTHVINDVTGLQTNLDTRALKTTQVVAGNGLTGGGALSSNVTITMGVPGTLTASTVSSATSTSHTHVITTTSAGVANTIVKTDENGGIGTSRYGNYGMYNAAQTSSIWSMGSAYTVNATTTGLGNSYGLVYSYISVSGSSVASKHQIHFAHAGVATTTINLTDGEVRSNKFTVVGGTSAQFLKADGSRDSNVYLTTNTVPAQTWASITGKPNSLAGYGILDAYTKVQTDAFLLDKINLNDTIQNTNPHGGRKLYINTLDNALAAADKKYYTSVTIHKKVVNSVNYPKPINVGNILLPQWEDSPIVVTHNGSLIFNNSYEGGYVIPTDSYAVIHLDFNEDGTAYYPGYPYGTYYLNFYHVDSPESAHVRTYNNFSSHQIGYKTIEFSNFVGNNTTVNILKADDGGNYQRRSLEFVIIPFTDKVAQVTQLEWKLTRPNFAQTSPLITNYGTNKLYQILKFGDQTLDNIILNPNNGNILANKFILPSGTASQFLKADGTIDTSNYELSFTKNTAFNKNFGTVAGTVAQGNDSRIINGQTAFGWQNHANLYPSRATVGGSANSVLASDTRSVNPLPTTDLNSGVWFDFKGTAVLGIPSGAAWAGVMTLVPYNGDSGNNNSAFRLAQSSNKLFFQNYNAGAWGTWNEIWSTNNFSQANINNWNTAFDNNHTHSNKQLLDTINQDLGSNYSPTFQHLNLAGYLNTGSITLGDTSGRLRLNKQASNEIGILSESNGWADMRGNNFITSTYGDASQWKQAFGWGDHASAGYITASALSPYAQTSWVNANFDKYSSWNLKTDGTQRITITSGGTLDIKGGTNVSVSYGAGGAVTISAVNTDTNTTYSPGDGISITGPTNVITNTKPNIVQTLGGSGNTITLTGGGSYPIPAQTWASITGKPSTFPATAHTHTKANITNFVENDYIHKAGNEIKTGTLTTTSFIKTGGTAAQFLKANGDSDNTSYLPTSVGSIAAIGTSYVTASAAPLNSRIKIILPFTMSSNTMVSFTIKVYGEYSAYELSVSGYLYGSPNQWYLPTVQMISMQGQANTVNVFVGRNPDGKAYVSLPRLTYMGIGIFNIVGGFNSQNWGEGWSIVEDNTIPNLFDALPFVAKSDNVNLIGNQYIEGTKNFADIKLNGNVVLNVATGVTLSTNQTITGSKTFTQSITAPAFYEGSLKKWKENILPYNKSGLELVNELEIVTFDRKDKSAVNKIGIIADDSPKEFLSEEKDSVDLYKTVFIQAKAIQELTKRLEDLELIIKNITNGR